jgi:hypothetical protein
MSLVTFIGGWRHRGNFLNGNVRRDNLVIKPIYKAKYYWHLFHKRHNELMVNDCLCEKMRRKLIEKALYHECQADKVAINKLLT